MKQTITIFLFIALMLLCGAEIFPKFAVSAKKKDNAVLYVRSAKAPAAEFKSKVTDYKELIKGMNGKGA